MKTLSVAQCALLSLTLSLPSFAFINVDGAGANSLFNSGAGSGSVTPWNPNNDTAIPSTAFTTWNLYFTGDGDDTNGTVDASITVSNLVHSYDWTATSKPSGFGTTDPFVATAFNATAYPQGKPTFGVDSGAVQGGHVPEAFLYKQDLSGGNSQLRIMLNGLDDTTTADDASPGFLSSGTVSYRATIEIQTFGQWTMSKIFHSGHGTGNPERLIYDNSASNIASTSGFYAAPNNLFTTGDLDGITEEGESGGPSSVTLDQSQNIQSAKFVYEVVNRGGQYQTFALGGVSFFNPIPEPTTLVLLLGGLVIAFRRHRSV